MIKTLKKIFKKEQEVIPSFPITNIATLTVEEKSYIISELEKNHDFIIKEVQNSNIDSSEAALRFNSLITKKLITNLVNNIPFSNVEIAYLNGIFTNHQVKAEYKLLQELLSSDSKQIIEELEKSGFVFVDTVGYLRIYS